MAIKLRPLDDRVVVMPMEAEEKTEGGIFLPDTAKERPHRGIVQAVGIGKLNETDGKRIPTSLKKGDKVLYGKYSGTEVKIEGEEYKILRESEVLAIES